jgi:hypothetical protein
VTKTTLVILEEDSPLAEPAASPLDVSVVE